MKSAAFEQSGGSERLILAGSGNRSQSDRWRCRVGVGFEQINESETAMQSKSKWIKGLSAKQPFSEAAQLAVRQRLPLVWYHLPLAAKKYADDAEHVHNLRVATRRAAATLEVFADTLPKRRAEWIARQLRRVRRAAGQARDMDVLAQRFGKARNGYERVADEILMRRIHAQKPIVTVYRKLKAKDFSQRVDELIEKIRWRGSGAEPSLGDAAREILTPIAKRFVRQSKADLTDMRELHQLRKDGKQLRYAMELLAGAFDREFREELYANVEQVQEKLGQINDHHVARGYYQRWAHSGASNAAAGTLEDLAAQENDAMLIEADAFRGWFHTARSQQLKQLLTGLK